MLDHQISERVSSLSSIRQHHVRYSPRSKVLFRGCPSSVGQKQQPRTVVCSALYTRKRDGSAPWRVECTSSNNTAYPRIPSKFTIINITHTHDTYKYITEYVSYRY